MSKSTNSNRKTNTKIPIMITFTIVYSLDGVMKAETHEMSGVDMEWVQNYSKNIVKQRQKTHPSLNIKPVMVIKGRHGAKVEPWHQKLTSKEEIIDKLTPEMYDLDE